MKQNKLKTEYDGSVLLRSVMQEAVLDSILSGVFQTDAYMEVYKSCKSRKVAEANASRLLSNAKVKARLDYKRRQLEVKSELTAKIVLAKLREIAFNELKSEDIQTQHQLSALDMINKHLGLYERDNTQRQGMTLCEILAIVGDKVKELPVELGEKPLLEAENVQRREQTEGSEPGC